MPVSAEQLTNISGGFKFEDMMMRYNKFAPRLYNFCKSLGMETGKIMPSRAFCSDENQGYPIIMIAKHFGTFPFNHGQVGGIVATDRHAPHAEHGKDMVIIQASHVGYDPMSKKFGVYKRIQTEHNEVAHTCGKIYSVLDWYQDEYAFACSNIQVAQKSDALYVTIDNQLLRDDRDEGLFLDLKKLICYPAEGEPAPVQALSTAKTYLAADTLKQKLTGLSFELGQHVAIGNKLSPDLFYYRRDIPTGLEGSHHLEQNLLKYMPYIVTSFAPGMLAAQINTQVEFDRTFRTIVKAHAYQGKKLVFIAGLHIDISPSEGQLFPLTKFVPWAAYVQDRDGSHYTLEQQDLMQRLLEQQTDNPDQIDLETAIQQMVEATEIKIELET